MSNFREIEQGLTDILSNYILGTKKNYMVEGLSSELQTASTSGARHNYQREEIRANPELRIFWKSNLVAVVNRKDKTVGLNKVASQKTYYVQKLLEKTVYYKFVGYGVTQ